MNPLAAHQLRPPGDFHVVHRAAWLVAGNGPPLANGAVLVAGDVILATGDYSRIKAAAPSGATLLDHGTAALIPALVNAHTHLELSSLKGCIALPQSGFPSWIAELFKHRAKPDRDGQQDGFMTGEELLASSGAGLYADITNGTGVFCTTRNATISRFTFLEVLGFDQDNLETALEPDLLRAFRQESHGYGPFSLAAHACYSTSAGIIREAKAWCRERNLPFSIHVAEHPEEIEFLQDGTGFCRELLLQLGREISHWTPPRTSPIDYLDKLGVLDEKTLLVHAVYLTDRDWETVAARGCPVCFCPRSNLNVNAGRPALEKAWQMGVTAALGTDSLASNSDLNLFAEAAHVLRHYPQIPAAAVLSMVTAGGARALRQEKSFGSIEAGKRAAFLAVSLPDALPASRLFEAIIMHGEKGGWRWAS